MKANYFLITVLILIITALCYFGKRQFMAYRNDTNSKKIIIGIPKVKMLEVMGDPDSKFYSTLKSGQEVYFYEPPFAASEGINIYIDTLSDKVVRIELFK